MSLKSWSCDPILNQISFVSTIYKYSLKKILCYIFSNFVHEINSVVVGFFTISIMLPLKPLEDFTTYQFVHFQIRDLR